MTTRPTSLPKGTSDGGGAAAPGSARPASVPETNLEQLRSLGRMADKEAYWLLFLIPYLLAWIAPFRTQGYLFDGVLRWCLPRWQTSNGSLAFQPFIPLGAALLIWSRRENLKTIWLRLLRNYPADHAKRRGNPAFFLFGCVALIFSYCVQVKGVAIGAEIATLTGAIYWVYGRVIFKALLLPLSFFCLMMPPPDTWVERLALSASRVSAQAAAVLIHLLMRTPATISQELTGTFLRLNGYGVEVRIYVSDGSGSLVCTLVFLFWYSLYRRLRIAPAASLIILGGIFAMAFNVIRVAVGGVAYSSQPGLSALLLEDGAVNRFLTGWLIDAAACITAWYATYALFLLARRLPAPVRSAFVRVGLASDSAAKPIESAMSFTGKRLSAAWTLSERGIEGALRRLFPRRSAKRRQRQAASGLSKFLLRFAPKPKRKNRW